MPPQAQLLDCGHVGSMAAVCQYEGCAKTLCSECHVSCDRCGRVLCRSHQTWRDDRRKVFCPRDSTNYTLKTLARKMLFSGGTNERQL